MPRILLHSATSPEIEPCLEFLKSYAENTSNHFKLGIVDLEICITGAGMVNTAFELGRRSVNSYDLAIQAGIAGSFGVFKPGELVRVEKDCFSELGAEDGDDFITLSALGFGEEQQTVLYAYRHQLLDALPKALGITVNTVHGNESSIKKLLKNRNAQIESMEGAAFIYAANKAGWPAVQLRAISNLVEKRDRSKWDIPKAVSTLNTFLIQFLKSLNEH